MARVHVHLVQFTAIAYNLVIWSMLNGFYYLRRKLLFIGAFLLITKAQPLCHQKTIYRLKFHPLLN